MSGLVTDDFSRADSLDNMGSATAGGCSIPWITYGGVNNSGIYEQMLIQGGHLTSEQATLPSSNPTTNPIAPAGILIAGLDSGDMYGEVTYGALSTSTVGSPPSGWGTGGLVFRYSDTGNFWTLGAVYGYNVYFLSEGWTVALTAVSNGVPRAYIAFTQPGLGAGNTLGVRCVSDQIEVLWNGGTLNMNQLGVSVSAVTDDFNMTATGVGIQQSPRSSLAPVPSAGQVNPCTISHFSAGPFTCPAPPPPPPPIVGGGFVFSSVV